MHRATDSLCHGVKESVKMEMQGFLLSKENLRVRLVIVVPVSSGCLAEGGKVVILIK